MRLTIHVIPNASQDEIVSRDGTAWKVRVAAPPIDGQANHALIRLLAKTFDCAPNQINIMKGHASKTKLVHVQV